YVSTWVMQNNFDRVLCPSYQGFRIYRETLSRFSCAASFIEDNKNGFKEFYKLREEQHGHQIEKVGRELREMMPFIKSKSIEK
ncbi:hypothetical protein ACT6QE_09665, partial [Staphylococcus aureus]